MSRERHEHQIKMLGSTFGGEMDDAISRAMNSRAGLDWFTDEQIAEIRSEMIGRAWFRHQINRENRRHYSKLREAAPNRRAS